MKWVPLFLIGLFALTNEWLDAQAGTKTIPRAGDGGCGSAKVELVQNGNEVKVVLSMSCAKGSRSAMQSMHGSGSTTAKATWGNCKVTASPTHKSS